MLIIIISRSSLKLGHVGLKTRSTGYSGERFRAFMALLFLRIILTRTSTEAHVYMPHLQGAKVKHFDVSSVIYHKFSHGAVSYTFYGENVNVMLELQIRITRK